MTTLTYGSNAPAHTASAETKSSAKAATKATPKTGIFTRLWNAMIEARMNQAMNELRMHKHLLPAEYEIAGNSVIRKNEDQIGFTRGR